MSSSWFDTISPCWFCALLVASSGTFLAPMIEGLPWACSSCRGAGPLPHPPARLPPPGVAATATPPGAAVGPGPPAAPTPNRGAVNRKSPEITKSQTLRYTLCWLRTMPMKSQGMTRPWGLVGSLLWFLLFRLFCCPPALEHSRLPSGSIGWVGSTTACSPPRRSNAAPAGQTPPPFPPPGG